MCRFTTSTDLPRLIFWMAVPIGVLLVVIIVVAIQSGRAGTSKRKVTTAAKEGADHGAAFHLEVSGESERVPTLFERTLPPVLTLLLSAPRAIERNW